MAVPSVRSAAAFLLAACLGVSAGIAAAPVEAAAKWTQLQSENFLFIGDASEGQIRRVAERLEQFRDVLLRVLPRANAQSAVPTIVMVFDAERSMTPVKPLFRGRPVDVDGYFQAGEDVNYIAVNAEHLEQAVPTISHEYAHFLINENQGGVPVWVNEGLAELYATFERMDDGRRVIIGRAPGHRTQGQAARGRGLHFVSIDRPRIGQLRAAAVSRPRLRNLSSRCRNQRHRWPGRGDRIAAGQFRGAETPALTASKITSSARM